MAEKKTITLEELQSYITSMDGAEKGMEYAGRVFQERDKLIEALNAFKGNAKSIDFLKGDIAEVWHGGTFNINAAQQSSTAHADVPRSTDLGSPDIVLNSGEEYQLKYYKTAKKSAEAQAMSNKQAANNPSTSTGATKRIESDKVNENASLYEGQGRGIPSDQLKDAKKELEKEIAKTSANRPDEAGRYQETLDNITDRVKNNEGVSSTPLTEQGSKDIAKKAQAGEVTPEDVNLTYNDVIKINYVMKNAMKAGLQSAAITAGISTVLSLSAKYTKEGKCFWDYTEEDWKDVLFEIGFGGLAGGVSATVLNIVGSYSASAVPGVSALLMAVFGIAALVPDYMDGKLTEDEFIVEAEMICFDAALILLTTVIGQTAIPVPALGAAIGSVAGMIAVLIIQEIWGDQLRELLAKFNEHIKTLFEKIKDFFAGIWEKLKAIKDLLEYLLDDDINYSLQCRYKMNPERYVDEDVVERSLNPEQYVDGREVIIIEREKREECYE